MPTLRNLAAFAATFAVLCVTAPAALASGTLSVQKFPPAGGTVTGTIPVRNADGSTTGARSEVINCGERCAKFISDFVRACDDGVPCPPIKESVTLTQTPAAGWAFTGWSNCTLITTEGDCRRSMADGDQVVAASFRDVGPPTVSLTGPVEDAKLNGSVAIGAEAADNAGVSQVSFSVNGDELFTDTNGGNGWSAALDTSAYAHAQVITVKAVAFDAAGNASVLDADDTRSYRIDRQTGLHFEAPTPAQGEWIGAGDPAVEVAFAGNDDTPTDVMSFRCDLGAGPAGCSSPLGASHFANDGDYSVTVKATDDAGPVANTVQITRSFHVDRTPPAVEIARPAEGSVQPPAFTPDFTVTEANPVSTTCSRDGGAFGACSALSGLAAGQHTLAVKAVDDAGNVTTLLRHFDVDGTAPALAITDGPAQNEIIRTGSARFTFTAGDPSGPLVRSCRLDGGFGPCTSATTHVLSGLAEGAHVFELRVADAAGNTATLRRDFVVNALRPTVDITAGPGEGAVVKATEATFRFRVTGGRAQCSLDSETAFGPCTSGDSHRVSGLGDGGHTFRVRVRDESNDEVIKARTFAVDTSLPPSIDEIIRQILNPTLSTDFDAFKRFTKYKRLVVKRVPAGATVTVKCKGKRCPRRTFKTRRTGNVRLSRFVRKRLRAGTTLTIRVTKPGAIGKQFVIRIRAGKQPTLKISQIT